MATLLVFHEPEACPPTVLILGQQWFEMLMGVRGGGHAGQPHHRMLRVGGDDPGGAGFGAFPVPLPWP